MKCLRALGVVLCMLMVGCAGWFGPNYRQPVAPDEPIMVRVSGYGAIDKGVDRSDARRRLMVMRASQLDAYRALAERVYGTLVSGSSGVNSFVLQNDSFRAYVDSYIRGAKVVAVNEHDDGVIETIMELKLEPRFRQCVRQVPVEGVPAHCQIPMPTGSDVPVVSPAKGQGASLYYLE